jgi:AcrR family transcriptional regulator
MRLILIAMKRSSQNPKKTGRPLSFNRDEALKKAMLTFWRHGYESTSISDLTAAMGVTAPSIYTAFGDKKSLFLEAMQLYAGSISDFEQSLNAAPTARAAVSSLLGSVAVAFTGESTPRGCLLASATASVSQDALDVQTAVAKVRGDIVDCLTRRIARDVAAGQLPEATQPASLALLTVAVIQGMSVLARDGLGRESLESIAAASLQAWPKT